MRNKCEKPETEDPSLNMVCCYCSQLYGQNILTKSALREAIYQNDVTGATYRRQNCFLQYKEPLLLLEIFRKLGQLLINLVFS